MSELSGRRQPTPEMRGPAIRQSDRAEIVEERETNLKNTA
jgi:hypothetical protein